MSNSNLLSLSPLDGRYYQKTIELRDYYSEYAMMKYRVFIEISYLSQLIRELNLPCDPKCWSDISSISETFTVDDANDIKKIEKTTNHDIKAVEYWIKQKLTSMGYSDLAHFVHYGLTSQDINTSTYVLQTKNSMIDIMLPNLQRITDILHHYARESWKIAMLSRTHGQPASPTTMGKEFMVFYERLSSCVQTEVDMSYQTKFGGAVGNFSALHLAHPNVNWLRFADRLCIENFDLIRTPYTTQIESYDNLCAHFDNWRRINTILIDLCRDIWQYISMNYFMMKIEVNEVGSSAMPHKVNPIDFENAEGNLQISNTIFEFFSRKLPISRLQRDLTDSTVLRNIGSAMGYSLIAIKSIVKGLNKLQINRLAINRDLNENWMVIAEAVQIILKRENIAEGYEIVKNVCRRHDAKYEDLIRVIENLNISESVKNEIRNLKVENYIGVVPEII